MVDNSSCVIDCVVGICAVGGKHEVDFICGSIQVLEDASSVVQANTNVSLCAHEREREKERGGVGVGGGKEGGEERESIITETNNLYYQKMHC